MLAVRFLPLLRMLLHALLGLLLVVTLFAVVRTWMKTADERGAYDLQPYWYWGHYVWAGVNPYLAYAERLPFPAGLTYIDGSAAQPDADTVPQLGRVPANTAPMLLLLSPLSFLTWTSAKFLWLFVNFALIIAIPWLTLRLLPLALQPPTVLKWLGALAFYALKGTREAAATGQTTLLVYALMIATLLLRQKHPLWAGVALGIALGKYSVALPVLLFLLLEKRVRVVLVAGAVQALALVGMAVLANGGQSTTWWAATLATLRVNWSMISHHASAPGVHLHFTLLRYPQVATGLLLLFALATVGVLVYTGGRGWSAASLLPVNSALVLLILLAVYHRNYDSLIAHMSLIVCLSAIATWKLPARQTILLGLLFVGAVGVMVLPGDVLRSLVADAQAEAFMLWLDRAITATVAILLVTTLWLLPRTPTVRSLHPAFSLQT